MFEGISEFVTDKSRKCEISEPVEDRDWPRGDTPVHRYTLDSVGYSALESS